MVQTKAQARLSVNSQSRRWSSGPCGTSATSWALKPTPTAVDRLAGARRRRAACGRRSRRHSPAASPPRRRRASARSARRAPATSRLGEGLKRAEHALLQRIARPPGAEQQRLAVALHDGQRQLAACIVTARSSAAGCRSRPRSARSPTRPPASSNGCSRPPQLEPPSPSAALRGVRRSERPPRQASMDAARRRALVVDQASCLGRSIRWGGSTMGRGRRTSKACVSRWAPCSQDHGQGQEQFPGVLIGPGGLGEPRTAQKSAPPPM